MTLRFFNGIQIDVPEDWSDRSTVLLAPKQDRNINLVVKRRPVPPDGLEHTVEHYVGFMQARFGTLNNLQTKAMNVAGQKGVAVRFEANQTGQGFRQTTLLYHAKGEEISATVTQLLNDPTPPEQIDRLLASVRPAGGGRF